MKSVRSILASPKGINGSHIAPIGLLLQSAADTGTAERMSDCLSTLDELWNDVLAEVILAVRIVRFLAQQFIEELGFKDIDAHRGQSARRVHSALRAGWRASR